MFRDYITSLPMTAGRGSSTPATLNCMKKIDGRIDGNFGSVRQLKKNVANVYEGN